MSTNIEIRILENENAFTFSKISRGGTYTLNTKKVTFEALAARESLVKAGDYGTPYENVARYARELLVSHRRMNGAICSTHRRVSHEEMIAIGRLAKYNTN